MQEANISIRVDKTVKEKFCTLCAALGLSTTSAITLFMKALIREKKIPFEIAIDETPSIQERGLLAYEALRKQASQNGIQDMSSDEINKIIKESRDERRKSN